MSEGGLTRQVAEWVSATQFEDLPRRVVEESKNQTLSVIAGVHAGHFSDFGRALRRTVKDWSAGKDATVIPLGERTSLHAAVFTNSALSAALEYDDYLFAAHSGHSAVVCALALAEKCNLSGKQLILAQVLANEIEGRLGAALVAAGDPMVALPACHLVGAAVVTAKALELDADATEAALGLALMQPIRALEPSFFGGDGRAIAAGSSTPVGIQAAQLAANGIGAPVDILGHPRGPLHALCDPPLLAAFTHLGSAWLTETLCYKIYPAHAALGTVLDCVLDIGRQHTVDAKKVHAVHVAASPLAVETDARVRPYLKGPETPTGALAYSIGYNVAAAIADKELSARQLIRDRIADPALWSLAAKVNVSLDDIFAQRARAAWLARPSATSAKVTLDFDPLHVSQFRMSAGARVRIELEDGRSFEAEEEVPEGAAGRAYDDRRKAVEDKFRRETRYSLRKERMEKAVDTILHLDRANAANVRELIRLCCSERG